MLQQELKVNIKDSVNIIVSISISTQKNNDAYIIDKTIKNLLH